MEQIVFKFIIEPLAAVLTFYGVLLISLVLWIFFRWRYHRTKSMHLMNSLPGICTSLGLLGTFAAICNSLGTINEETLEIDVIIRNLIPAFTSSIAGLLCAIFATIQCKNLYIKEDKEIEEKVKKKSPEECLYDIVSYSEGTNMELSKMCVQLTKLVEDTKTYNDNLNSTISQQRDILETFINDFVKKMDDIFTKMHGQIEQNIKDFGEDQFQKSAKTLETLTQKMSEISTGLLAEQKNKVQQMIDGTNSELRTVSNNVSEQMTTIGDQMSKALKGLQDSQDTRLSGLIANYDNLSKQLADQNSEFAAKMTTQMNEEYEKVQKHSTESLQQMVDLKAAYAEVNEQMLTNTTNLNQSITSDLRTSLGAFVTSVTSEVSTLKTAIAENVKALQESYSYISEHVANIKGNYESASQSFQDAVNNAHRMNESQEKMLSSIDKSMNGVVKTNEKVDQVLSILDKRQDSIENLISQINEISTTIEILQKLESQLNRIANK